MRGFHRSKAFRFWVWSAFGVAFLLGSAGNRIAVGGVIYTNIGDPPSSYEPGAAFEVRAPGFFNFSQPLPMVEYAVGFRVGGAADVALGDVAMFLKGGVDYFTGSFDLHVYSDAGTGPGALLESVHMANVNTNSGAPFLYPGAELVTVRTTGRTVLHAGSVYWIGITAGPGSFYHWYASRIQGGHYGFAGRSAAIVDGSYSSTSFGDWGASFGPTFTPNIAVFAAVPEPATAASAILASFMSPFALRRRRRPTFPRRFPSTARVSSRA